MRWAFVNNPLVRFRVRHNPYFVSLLTQLLNTSGNSQQQQSAAGSGGNSLRNSAGLAHDLHAMEQLLAAMSQRQKRNVGVNSGSASDQLRRTNSGVRMPTILEKIVSRSSLGAGGLGGSGNRRSKRDNAGDEEMVNLTQNALN